MKTIREVTAARLPGIPLLLKKPDTEKGIRALEYSPIISRSSKHIPYRETPEYFRRYPIRALIGNPLRKAIIFYCSDSEGFFCRHFPGYHSARPQTIPSHLRNLIILAFNPSYESDNVEPLIWS
ncbi:MAG: hypothetical protein HQ556_13550 [Candidatus Marinimicrobia bacterium]|nr:hypothetical protein [Candidatus Neomarinimicrobiota bacterium]